ncbi:MAG: DUF3017 domain-containing protein [Haloechinothrix sp.]
MARAQRREHRPGLAHLPFGLVLVLVAVGMVRIYLYHWREGAVLIGASLLVAALLRAVLSDEQVGLIAIRGRAIDVLLYSGFGVMILFVALTITGGPFG